MYQQGVEWECTHEFDEEPRARHYRVHAECVHEEEEDGDPEDGPAGEHTEATHRVDARKEHRDAHRVDET